MVKLMNKVVSLFAKDHAIFVLSSITITILSVIFIIKHGNIQFGGCDGSGMLSDAWKMHLGHKPYRDLVTYMNPLHLIGCKLAFNFWGIHWSSFVKLGAVFAALTLPLQVFLLKRLKVGAIYSILFATAIQCMTMISSSWWWYNHTTSVVACLFVSSALLFSREPASHLNKFLFFCTTSLLALAKPNVAGVLLLFTLLILAWGKRTRHWTFIILLGAGAVDLMIFSLFNLSVADLYASYTVASGRVTSLDNVLASLWHVENWECKQTLLLLIPCIIGALLAFGGLLYRRRQEVKQGADFVYFTKDNNVGYFVIAFVGILGGMVGMATNGELNFVDAPLIILGLSVVLLAIVKNLGFQPWLRVTVVGLLLTSTVLLAANGLRFGVNRWRVMTVGYGMYYEDAPLTKIQDPPLFEGMSVGPRLLRTIDQVTYILKRHGYYGQQNAPVFFGTRMDFAYAMTGIHPAKGIPNNVWDRFGIVKEGEKNVYIERFKDFKFALCIFFKRDYVYLPLEIVHYLYRYYNIYDYGELTVHVLKA